MSDEERQFRRGYRQGFHAAVKAFDRLLKDNRVPQDQAYSFLDSFAGDGKLYGWLQSLGEANDSQEPPDALQTYLARLGRAKGYRAE